MPLGTGDSEELNASRDARVAMSRRDKLEQYCAALRRAEELRLQGGGAQGERVLRDLLSRAESELRTAHRRAGGTVFSRKRPRRRPTTGACRVFLDECGNHDLRSADAYPVFALAAVIVREEDYPNLEARWRGWKAAVLGRYDASVHEPEVRNRLGSFGGPDGPQVTASLGKVLGELPFATAVCVVHRGDYLAEHGAGPVDDSLPAHVYLMALDFLLERVVMILDTTFHGARAELTAESRGPREDAMLQYEFARLHLEGTSYISPGWFRQQLAPGILFKGKDDNSTGLQLADLVARPVADKVCDPTATPTRWSQVQGKLCLGQETKNSILGLKVMPWRDRYEDLWKS